MNDQLKYATVHYSVKKQLGISFNEYILLDMVYHLSAKYGHCFKSVSEIANDLDLGWSTVKEMFARLTEKELLVYDGKRLTVTQAYIDIAYYDKTGRVTKITETEEITETVKPSRKPRQITETVDKNNNRTTNNYNVELLEILNRTMNRNFRVLPLSANKTLKQFTLTEIEQALTNAKSEPWFKDKLLSSDYLLRDSTIDNLLSRTVRDKGGMHF